MSGPRRAAGRLAGLKRFVVELSGRSGARFASLLDEQVDASLAGARLVLAVALGERSMRTDEVRAEVSSIEHRGDRARGAVVEQLSRSLVTPIDREDLFRLSRSIDDVLDNLRDFAREADLYDVADQSFAVPLLQAVVEGIEALYGAVAELAGSPTAVTTAALGVRKSANTVRRMYQEGLAELFATDPDAETLKRRELLRRLDVVALRLGESADVLADGAVKRQQ